MATVPKEPINPLLSSLAPSLQQRLLKSDDVERSFLLLFLQQCEKEWFGLAKTVLSQATPDQLEQIQAWLLYQKSMAANSTSS
mmetsp:Transcript_5845/g.12840  ORF Transcript_5845/g.12840 Transcript_5845/m.12840 type:complete len:83 (+) Transcript_5845:1-249(+)